MKDINIVTVNYLRKEEILTNLVSLFADLKNCPFSYQITVVDNSNDQDGIRNALKEKFPEVIYINSGDNVGFGKGNNIGFKSTSARYYFALNPDIIIPENSNTIERLIKFMDANPLIGCIGPKLVGLGGELQYSCYRFDWPSIAIKPLRQIHFDEKYPWCKNRTDHLLMGDFDHNETRPVDWVLGAAILGRGEVLEKIGWFDERYFMYLEDADLCQRVWLSNYSVYYVHDIVIRHKHTRQSSHVPGIINALFKNKLARIHMMSWFKYIWKWRNNFKYYGKIS